MTANNGASGSAEDPFPPPTRKLRLTEFAIAVEARRSGRILPDGLLRHPDVIDGARGVRFVEAAAESARMGGTWVDCSLAL